MSKKARLLLINDDGINAPGLKHLWRSLKNDFDITIVAPAIEQSGVGLAITLRKPLQIENVEWENGTSAWKITGTPADCVKLALKAILKETPDLIVSGINRGSNSGRNVLYSGTVGGVIEGVLRNIPGVAFSCSNFDHPEYHIAEKHIYPVVSYLLDHPLPRGTFLNVNFPDHGGEIKGFKLARQGKGYWIDSPDERLHPEGRPYYWLGGKWHDHDEEEDSDVFLLKQGFMAAVPIHVNELTDHDQLKQRKDVFETLFQKS